MVATAWVLCLALFVGVVHGGGGGGGGSASLELPGHPCDLPENDPLYPCGGGEWCNQTTAAEDEDVVPVFENMRKYSSSQESNPSGARELKGNDIHKGYAWSMLDRPREFWYPCSGAGGLWPSYPRKAEWYAPWGDYKVSHDCECVYKKDSATGKIYHEPDDPCFVALGTCRTRNCRMLRTGSFIQNTYVTEKPWSDGWCTWGCSHTCSASMPPNTQLEVSDITCTDTTIDRSSGGQYHACRQTDPRNCVSANADPDTSHGKWQYFLSNTVNDMPADLSSWAAGTPCFAGNWNGCNAPSRSWIMHDAASYDPSKGTEWLQLDLGKQERIGGLATLGGRSGEGPGYVSRYEVSASVGKQGVWADDACAADTGTATHGGGSRKCRVPCSLGPYNCDMNLGTYAFRGNVDHTGDAAVMRRRFVKPIIARFVRVHPTAWYKYPEMRLGWFRYTGIQPRYTPVEKRKCEIQATGVNAGPRGAANVVDIASKLCDTRLNVGPGGLTVYRVAPNWDWEPGLTDIGAWAQIELPALSAVAGVIVQRGGESRGSLKKITVKVSLDSTNWHDVDGGVQFDANNEKQRRTAGVNGDGSDGYLKTMGSASEGYRMRWYGYMEHQLFNAEGEGTDTRIRFAKPVRARYLRIFKVVGQYDWGYNVNFDWFGPKDAICQAMPSNAPTKFPTPSPTPAPSEAPTTAPSKAPSTVPTFAPSSAPSAAPASDAPSAAPSASPSMTPTSSPTFSPTMTPTSAPTRHVCKDGVHAHGCADPAGRCDQVGAESENKFQCACDSGFWCSVGCESVMSGNAGEAVSEHVCIAVTSEPSASPTPAPSTLPSSSPSVAPSASPTVTPTVAPSAAPSVSPTAAPSVVPTDSPTAGPSTAPITAVPTTAPSAAPSTRTLAPTPFPSAQPSAAPSAQPSAAPSAAPSHAMTSSPSPSPTETSAALPEVPEEEDDDDAIAGQVSHELSHPAPAPETSSDLGLYFSVGALAMLVVLTAVACHIGKRLNKQTGGASAFNETEMTGKTFNPLHGAGVGADDEHRWVIKIDNDTRKAFFLDEITGKSSWSLPAGTALVGAGNADAPEEKAEVEQVQRHKWTTHTDPTTGRRYSENLKSRRSTWTLHGSDDEDDDDKEVAKTDDTLTFPDLAVEHHGEWDIYTDQKTGRRYSQNIKTRRSTWTLHDDDDEDNGGSAAARVTTQHEDGDTADTDKK